MMIAFCSFGTVGVDIGAARPCSFEDPLEGDLGELSGAPNICGRTFEEAHDDLVITHEHRSEVANALPDLGHFVHAGLNPPVELGQVALLDAGPEAFGDKARGVRCGHDIDGRAARRRSESGVSLPFDRPLALVHHAPELGSRVDTELVVDAG
jgi:hypothetical protein